MSITNLKAKSFSKKCKAEVLEFFPTATVFDKKHIAGMGYVWFVRNSKRETLAKVYHISMKGMVVHV